MNNECWALLLAAGQGSRLAAATGGEAKQFLRRNGAPLWWRAARALTASPRVRGLVVVFPPERLDAATAELADLDRDHVLGVPGLPVTDTIKEVDAGNRVRRTPARADLRAAQTPQAFRTAALAEAHRRAEAEGWEVTDDASLMERCGHPVAVVEGDPANRKITLPEDLALLADRDAPRPCSGWGYDVHRYGGSRPLVLGGVPIPGEWTVSAHSDGDVLLHALMDAVLGCLAAGDIGRRFPDDDPRWDGASSSLMLDMVMDMAAEAGLEICHVDLTVIAQKPRLAPHVDLIRRNVARLMSLREDQVNLKATTEEGLGFTGECLGLKAVALVSGLRRRAAPAFDATPDRG